jgi:integrase
MRRADDGVHGRRLRALIVVLWRAGLRIHEALALTEADLDARRGIAAGAAWQGRPPPRGRHGRLGLGQLAPWLQVRVRLPIGPLFCVINGPTCGRLWSASAARSDLRQVSRRAVCGGGFARHQLRHAHAVEVAREGVPLSVIQRQLGKPTSASRRQTNLGITLGATTLRVAFRSLSLVTSQHQRGGR